MNLHTDLAERRSALDTFAGTAEEATHTQAAQLPAVFPTQDRVFGAQRVAVYRDEARILNKLKALAAAAGSDWYYRWSTKNKDGGTEWVEGPSIKLTNDLARIYGNCDVDIRVMDLGNAWLYYARFTDFETGYSLTRPFQQRKSQKTMKADADRLLDIAFQIGASKAIRNVVANALQTFADYAVEEAKNALVEKVGRSLDSYREKVVRRLAEMDIDLKRVEAKTGRPAREWLAPDVARIIAELQAINDGMATADDAYPPIKQEPAPTENEKAKTAAIEKFAEGEQTEAKPKDQQDIKGDDPSQTSPSQAGDSAADVAGDIALSGGSSAAQETTTSAPASEDLDPRDFGIDPIEAARKRGWQAREDKSFRRAVPPEYRNPGREDEARAWEAGWDDNKLGKPRPE